jgi:nucleoside 2-deoxyribosyltransferase
MATQPNVYLAGPLFTQAERRWNQELAKALTERGFDMLVPQVLAEALISETGFFDPKALFNLAVETVKKSDVVLAVLDGADPDSGTAFECGVAWSSGIPIVGLRTDCRKGGDGTDNVNLMLSASSLEVVFAESLVYVMVPEVAEKVAAALWRATKR